MEIPQPMGETVPVKFGITDARHYFEENATDLAPLRFKETVATKNPNQPIPELSPDWKFAMQSGHSGVSLIEVPIRSNSYNIYKETVFKEGKKILNKCYEARRRLIIARRNTGETDMFVITIVPLVTAGGNVIKSMENFRYLGGGDFTGRVFCSTLDGKFVKAFGYTNGQLNGTLLVMKRSELEKHADEGWNQHYSSINLQEGVRTRAGTYVFDEGNGNPDVCIHGYKDGTCPICMDEVVVVACPYCHVTNGCVCSRCFGCGNKEPACTCSKCWVCGHKLSECTCYSYPDPDPNPGGSGGGGHVTPPPPDPEPEPGTDPENKDTPPQIHTVTTTDQLSREDIANFKRKAQRGNTCVPTVMEYISKLLNNGENYSRREIKRYFKKNIPERINISRKGVPTKMIPAGMIHFFGNNNIGQIAYGDTSFNYVKCINSGNVIMTNVEVKNSSGETLGWHNLLIIGYAQNGNYIYIDPNDSSNFYECHPNYIHSNSVYKYNFEIKF